MSARRTRKQRRAIRAILKHGTDARPTHKSPSGRTGSVRSSQLKREGGPEGGSAGSEGRKT